VHQPLVIAGLTAGLLLLNGVVMFALARLFRFATAQAFEVALLLAASGEFSFVILQTAAGDGLMEPRLAHLVFVSSTVSMFCIPLLAMVAAAVVRRVPSRSGPALSEITQAGPPRVLIVGYGRVGHLVAEMLTVHGIPWLAVDRSARTIDAARKDGREVFFGDASRRELLQRIGLDTARALVVTMDSPEGIETVVATARDIREDLTIVARARDAEHAKRLYGLGATDAVPEAIEASLQLSEALLIGIGVPAGPVIASVHERRDAFRRELNDPQALGGRSRRTQGS
jgi:CPA2 family monovalent cation:H+ antiporter-2